jgi:hypothetical protein
MKNLFDVQSEEPGGPEGERQARIELARLDGVDGLPGDVEGVGQLGLRSARSTLSRFFIGTAGCRTAATQSRQTHEDHQVPDVRLDGNHAERAYHRKRNAGDHADSEGNREAVE